MKLLLIIALIASSFAEVAVRNFDLLDNCNDETKTQALSPVGRKGYVIEVLGGEEIGDAQAGKYVSTGLKWVEFIDEPITDESHEVQRNELELEAGDRLSSKMIATDKEYSSQDGQILSGKIRSGTGQKITHPFNVKPQSYINLEGLVFDLNTDELGLNGELLNRIETWDTTTAPSTTGTVRASITAEGLSSNDDEWDNSPLFSHDVDNVAGDRYEIGEKRSFLVCYKTRGLTTASAAVGFENQSGNTFNFLKQNAAHFNNRSSFSSPVNGSAVTSRFKHEEGQWVVAYAEVTLGGREVAYYTLGHKESRSKTSVTTKPFSGFNLGAGMIVKNHAMFNRPLTDIERDGAIEYMYQTLPDKGVLDLRCGIGQSNTDGTLPFASMPSIPISRNNAWYSEGQVLINRATEQQTDGVLSASLYNHAQPQEEKYSYLNLLLAKEANSKPYKNIAYVNLALGGAGWVKSWDRERGTAGGRLLFSGVDKLISTYHNARSTGFSSINWNGFLVLGGESDSVSRIPIEDIKTSFSGVITTLENVFGVTGSQLYTILPHESWGKEKDVQAMHQALIDITKQHKGFVIPTNDASLIDPVNDTDRHFDESGMILIANRVLDCMEGVAD